MNVRKSVDCSAMFAALDTLMLSDLPQMELYRAIGKVISGRPEKSATAAAAEYLRAEYPDAVGFSPRNLRRMRDFYQAYEDAPEVLAEAMHIGWTQNVVILEADLTLWEQAWYLRAVYKFGWSKLELSRKIQKRVHETEALDSTADSCYYSSNGGDENGAEKTSGTFLQGLWDAEAQRELQRQRPRGAYLQSLFPPLTGAADGGDDVAPSGESAASPPERGRDDLAEKSDPRSPARGEVPGLCGLRGAVSPAGAKPEKAGTVHSNAGAAYRRRGLRSRWRPGVCQGVLPGQPDAASHCPHAGGWHAPNHRAAAQNHCKAVKVDVTHAGNFWWGEDYCDPDGVGLEEETPLWNVHVEYSNGDVQDVGSADEIPDPVLELLSALAELFE